MRDFQAVIDTVAGYVDGFEKAQTRWGFDADTLEELLLDNGYEQCPCCGWFVPSYELIPAGSDDPDGACENCRKKE